MTGWMSLSTWLSMAIEWIKWLRVVLRCAGKQVTELVRRQKRARAISGGPGPGRPAQWPGGSGPFATHAMHRQGRVWTLRNPCDAWIREGLDPSQPM